MGNRNRPEAQKRPPQPTPDDLRFVVALADLQAAADRLESAAVAHADAVRRGEDRHVAVTRDGVEEARRRFSELAGRACNGTGHLRTLLREVYEHMIVHDGRRLAVRLRPWVK